MTALRPTHARGQASSPSLRRDAAGGPAAHGPLRARLRPITRGVGTGGDSGLPAHLTNEKQLTPATLVIVVSALRFLSRVTLHKTWSIEAVIPAPKKPQT